MAANRRQRRVNFSDYNTVVIWPITTLYKDIKFQMGISHRIVKLDVWELATRVNECWGFHFRCQLKDIINRSWRDVGSTSAAAMTQRCDVLHYFRLHIWNLHHPFGMWVNFHADVEKFEKNCCVLRRKIWPIPN